MVEVRTGRKEIKVWIVTKIALFAIQCVEVIVNELLKKDFTENDNNNKEALRNGKVEKILIETFSRPTERKKNI